MRPDGPGQSARLMLEILPDLKANNVDYAVIGAMAGSVHGVVRASLDADLVVFLTVPQLRDLEQQLKRRGFQTNFRLGDPEDPIPALVSVVDSYGNRVDILAGLRGLEAAAFSRVMEVPFEGLTLRIIGLEDFIAMKVFAGGPLDLDDARRTMVVAKTTIDRPLLRRLVERYGKAAVASLDKLLTETTQ